MGGHSGGPAESGGPGLASPGGSITAVLGKGIRWQLGEWREWPGQRAVMGRDRGGQCGRH